MKNIVICGCVRNCEPYIDGVFENIKVISSYCNVVKVIISYDVSTDKSLTQIDKYKTCFDIDVIVNKNKLHSERVVNITNARNSYMNHMNKLTTHIDRFIVMDFDDVCSSKINEDSLKKVFDHENEDTFQKCCITFNNSRYYDFWALSLEDYVYSVWHTNNPKKMMWEMKKIMTQKLDECNCYIEVDSAFNGFGIYDYTVFRHLRYDCNIRNTKYNTVKVKKLIQNGYNLYFKGIDCEHRSFHFKAKENDGKIIILKDSLFQPYCGEHASFLYV